MTAYLAQARTELVLTLRRGESILLTLGIPVLLLVFFSQVDVLPKPAGVDDPIDFLAPGVIALALMSTAMVNVAIATGFERQYGVLKRLGATPLGRPRLLMAKTTAVLAIEVVQLVVLVPLSLLLGWDPDATWVPFLLVAALGTVAFAGLGLLMAGTLRAELTLALANGLYLVLLLLGGMIIPLSELPGPMEAFAKLLPAAALAAGVDGTLTAGASVPGWAWATLAVWAIATPVAAALTFRWE
jgi:ABC-2 type transport system permease protein